MTAKPITETSETQQQPTSNSAATEGLFAPESMIRRLSQEALGLLGGGRAILLQLAHPLVAAGVNDYSTFQADPLSRLLSTLELMHTLVFAGRPQAEQALCRFHAVHRQIRGQLPESAGTFASGTSYHASDPGLLLWVAATLVDTTLVTYERFVAPFTADEQRRFYKDVLVLAQLLGIPEESLPPDLEGFRQYMAEMLAGETLVVTGTARSLAWDVLQPDGVGLIPAASARLLRFTTAGLLPPHLRRAYRLPWSPRRQRLFERLGRATVFLRPWVPRWVWQSPLLGGGLPRMLLWGATGARVEGE